MQEARSGSGKRLGVAVVALAVLGLAGVLIQLQPQLGAGWIQPASAPKVVERRDDVSGLYLAVELDVHALKSDIEEAARGLLVALPAERPRTLDVWLGPRGPFNPVYATVRLESGQKPDVFHVFLHRH